MKTFKGKKIVTTVDEYEFSIMAETMEQVEDVLKNGYHCNSNSINIVYSETNNVNKNPVTIISNLLTAQESDNVITIEEYKINK